MGVIVGETPTRQAPPRPRPGVAMLVAVAAATVAVFVFGSPGGPPETGTEESPTLVLDPITVDDGYWRPEATVEVSAFDARRAGGRYVFGAGTDIVSIGPDGTVSTSPLPGIRSLGGVTTAGDRVVAYGTDGTGPAVWLSDGGADPTFDRVTVPLDGLLLAASMRGEELTVIGTRSGEQNVRIAARWTPSDGSWLLEPIDAPHGRISSVAGGFVARGALGPDRDGYFFSPDGTDWAPVGEVVIKHVGDYAAMVGTDEGLVLRVVGDDRTLTPPEWPIVAVWDLGEKVWLQARSTAWWSDDGSVWHPVPLDRAHGLGNGIPIALPFEDGLVAVVERLVNQPRQTFVWESGS